MVKAILFDFFGVMYVSRRLGFSRRLVRNQDILDLSQSLRPQYKVGLLTNMGAGVLDKYFTQGEIEKYFDRIVVSGDVELVKPQPEMYELAAKIVGEEPQNCVLIDDTEINCQGAVAAGMKAIMYNSTEQLKRDLAEILAEE